MIRLFQFRLFFALALVGAMCCAAGWGQQQQQGNPYAPPPAPKTPSTEPDKNCSFQATKGSGQWKSTSTCPPASPTAQDTSSPAQDKDPGQQKKKSADEANPFPEATSQKAEDAAKAANSGSKTDTPDYSSSRVDLKKTDDAGSESRVSDGAGGYIHDPELAAKDDKVGQFYLQRGDYKGAYDRYKEATEVAPEDADAVFGLAESARGLHQTQEAVSNYQLYLDVFPDGKKSKEARKALAAMNTPPKK